MVNSSPKQGQLFQHWNLLQGHHFAHRSNLQALSDNTRETHMIHKAKNSLNEQALPKHDEKQENCKVL